MFNNFRRETAAALKGFWSHLSVWCQTCAHNALWEISLKTSSSYFGSKNWGQKQRRAHLAVTAVQ